MLNLGNVNYDNLTPLNTILKTVGPGTVPSINAIGASKLSDDGASLTYNGKPIAGAASGTAVAPGVIYSAAGTPLPAATAGLKGARAVVSDATTPTYLGAYVSGGAVVAGVICTGSAWVTG
jgi:hypothetical protein